MKLIFSYNITTEILKNIKNGTSPEVILDLFDKNHDNTKPKVLPVSISLSENIISNEDIEHARDNLKLFIKEIQEFVVPLFFKDKVLFLMIEILLDKKFCIGNRNYFTSDLINMLNKNQECFPETIKILSKYHPLLLEDIVEKDINILEKVPVEEFKIIMCNIYERKNMGHYFLTIIFKKLLKIDRNDLIDELIKIYHKYLKEIGCDFLLEIEELIELPEFSPELFDKSMDLNPENYIFYFYLSITIQECSRLIKEFERIINIPTLSKERYYFFTNDIIRLREIRRLANHYFEREKGYNLIRKRAAANKIVNAWYEYIRKICNPEHPKMKQKFKEWFEKN